MPVRTACSLLLVVGGAASSCVVPSGPADEELPPISPNRPTFSDSPGLIPGGHAQLETGYTFARRRGDGADTESHTVPEMLARYRVHEAVEAWVFWGGYVWSDTEAAGRSRRSDGAGDAGVAVLAPLTAQEGWVPALTVQARTTLGVGSAGLGADRAVPTLKLLWGYGGGVLPDWFGAGGNLILGYPAEGGERFAQPAASLFTTFGPADSATSAFAEWFVVGRPSKGAPATQSVDGGIVHRLDDRTAVDARVGFGLDSRADDVFGGVGISFLF